MPFDQNGQWVDSRWEPTIPFTPDKLPEMRVRARVDAMDAMAAGVNVALLQEAVLGIEKLGELSEAAPEEAAAAAKTEEFARHQAKLTQTADDLEALAFLMIVYPTIVKTPAEEIDDHHMHVGRLTVIDRFTLFGLLAPKEVVARATEFPDGGAAGQAAGVEPAQPVPPVRGAAKRSAAAA